MKRILVVDDSSMIRALFRHSLAAAKDYRVREARNGQEALDNIAAEGEPDLIFLDVNMPVMDGLEFLATSAGAGLVERVPVVIVSTEGREEDVQRGLDAGARAYLRKPFKPADLLPLVEKLTSAPAAGAAGTEGNS
jgi:two-component system, chemotaxis family, chemotaxis protein CheY